MYVRGGSELAYLCTWIESYPHSEDHRVGCDFREQNQCIVHDSKKFKYRHPYMEFDLRS